MLDSRLLILKSSKLCFDAKKVVRPLGQILTFFVLTKTLFFTASTSLQRNLHFLASSNNFLTFLKKCCFARLFNIDQSASKSLLLRRKSAPPAWSDSYIFCFDQNLVFTTSNKKCKNLTKRAEHFLDVKVSFLNHFGQYWTILRNNIFSKMWENCVMKQENGGFFVN